MNDRAEDSAATTENGFTAFTLDGNPAIANGVTVFLEGNLDDRRRATPTGIDLEQVLRDFIFGTASDVRITLSGLQPGTAFNIVMYAFDTSSAGPRHAVWTANGAPLFETFFDGSLSPASSVECMYKGLAVSSAEGTIILQSARGANDGGPHWAFVNALILEIENPCYNAPPKIQAADAMVVGTNTPVIIDAAVSDDGRPYEEGCDPANPAAGDPYGLTFRWVQTSGPAPVLFTPLAADTEDITAVFTLPGTYELTLYVSDGPTAGGSNDAKTTTHVITIDASAPLNGDINRDGFVDLDDLGILAAQWLDTFDCFERPYCADLDVSGNVAGNDFAMLSENWLVENSKVLINEFVASNRRSLLDGDGNSSDWIELYNSDTKAVSLAGWYLTDDLDDLRKWPFPPQATLGAGAYMVVFASEQPADDYVDSKGYLHTNFALAQDGECLALVSPSGRIVHTYRDFPPQEADISYGMWHSACRYFATPTPGQANQEAFLGFTDKPSHNHKRGFYDQPFDLRILCDTPDAVIRYTLDGSEPTEQNGLLYDPNTSIGVATTVTVRSMAFKPGYRPSRTTTHTYIFVNDVARQPAEPPGWPTDWGYSLDAGAVVPADYEMDPRVVENTLSDYSVRDALLAIPSVSISMAPDDFISDVSGIYANPLSRWERKCSLEYILPDGTDGFQEDCKTEVHGNASRRPARMQKHSLRLTFTSLYGSAKLNYPLFADSDVDTFNQLVLRAGFCDSWGLVSWVPTRYRPNDSMYIRDVWMKESLGAMGQPTSHGDFVHLYVNGLYFGLHNLTERLAPDFFADHLGGRAEDWQINEDFGTTTPPPPRWNAMMAIDPSTAAGYGQMQEHLEVGNFADYILLHLYADAEDWPRANGYAAANPVSGDGRFRFFVWDQEIVLDYHGRAAQRIDDTSGVGSLFQKMRTSNEFRLLFADRVYRHCFNNGALTASASQERYRRIADMIDKAIVAESARWGDTQMSTPYGNAIDQPNPPDNVDNLHYPPAPHGPDYYFTREDSWLPERDNVINNYIPAIHDTANDFALLNLLRAIGLYPGIDPPRYRINGMAQHGGYVSQGSTLTMVNPNGRGTIYYTLDGADPRRPAASYPAANLLLVPEAAPKNIWIGSEPSPDWTGGDEPFDDSAWTHGSYVQGKTGGVGYDIDPGYLPWISYDVKSRMYNTAYKFAYIRIPFTAEPADLTGISFLNLRMRYDDGFVAYLNGHEIARSPGITESPWTTTSHETTSFEEFSVLSHADKFKSGRNILAIFGLNKTATSTDFLISVELVAGTDDQTPPDVSPTAKVYDSAVPLPWSTRVKSRVRDGGTWSALADAMFAVGDVGASLRITELMYHPSDPNTEYIELQNVGAAPINLAQVALTKGVNFGFPPLGLDPGGYVLVVRNRSAFETLYGTNLTIAGEYAGSLDNAGEHIRLVDAADAVIHDFQYEDHWFDVTDGRGFSLTVRDPASTDPALWGVKKTWQPSTWVGGSPGGPDEGPGPDDIVINELLAHANTETSDWIELHNTTDREIDIGGWYLSDKGDDEPNLMKYRIADGTTIPAYGYLVFYQHLHFGNPADAGCRVPFGLSENGETLFLSGGYDDALTGWRTSESFGASRPDVAFGRYQKSTGTFNFVAMSENTPGEVNAYPAVGPVVISEIMYHPVNYSDSEYVELLNIDASSVVLYDDGAVEPWLFTDENGIEMPIGPGRIVMAPGERILLVHNRAAFDAEFGAPAGTQILEWVDGSLDNAGEQIQLSLPGDADELGRRLYIRVDRVVYSDGAHPAGEDPWPNGPDGNGLSLTRIHPAEYGNDVINWQASLPTPGTQ